jgi:hypothetical protein
MTILESMAPSYSSINAMRQSTEYMTFERRWQLPVYFQLRWKEIVGTYEAALTSSAPVEGWALPQTGAAWTAWSRCWSEKVFIPELAPRFWRLSLQVSLSSFPADVGLTSRSLRDWVLGTGSQWMGSSLPKKISVRRSQHSRWRRRASWTYSNSGPKSVRRPSPSPCHLRVSHPLFAFDLKADGADYASLPSEHLQAKIISILTRRCTEPLKLVRSVASQFRAAPAPTLSSSSNSPSPSYYVPTVFKPLQTLYSSRPPLRDTYGPTWSTSIAETVFLNYASILASVRKTEDLLRRHRKSKKNTFSLFGGGGGGKEDVEGEEERFRKQMMVDAEGLRRDAEALGVDVGISQGYKELVEVINRPAE